MRQSVNYKSFSSKLAARQMPFAKLPLYFVRCKDAVGRDCHFFIKSTPLQLLKLKTIRDGCFDLEQYGEIIASGFGSSPDPYMIARLEQHYDIVVDID